MDEVLASCLGYGDDHEHLGTARLPRRTVEVDELARIQKGPELTRGLALNLLSLYVEKSAVRASYRVDHAKNMRTVKYQAST